MAGVEGRPDWLIQNVFFQLSERTLMERFSFGWWFGTFYYVRNGGRPLPMSPIYRPPESTASVKKKARVNI